MFEIYTKISGVSVNKVGLFARVSRCRTMLAAAVATTCLGLASTGFAADITAVTTTTTTGAATSTNGVSGWPEGTTSGYTFAPTNPATHYNVSYGGTDSQINSVTTGTGPGAVTYITSGPLGTTKFETYTGLPPVTSVWYDGTGGPGTNPNLTVQGPAYTNAQSAFGANNILLGADNAFSSAPDTINSAQDQGNVARIDVLFTGFAATSTKAFAIFDRGQNGAHDILQIAAITSLNAGLPASYGQLFTEAEGTWGNTDLLPANAQEDIFRSNISGGALRPATSLLQGLGGTLIPTSALVAPGTTIYGYSIFSGAVTSSDNLVAYNSLPLADDEVNGGLDPSATLGNLYSVAAVPEPTTAALLTVASAGLLARRSRRKPALTGTMKRD